MATWHVTINDSTSVFEQEIERVLAVELQSKFAALGFTVRLLPLRSSAAFSVSHANEGAITLFMLVHDTSCCTIQQVR